MPNFAARLALFLAVATCTGACLDDTKPGQVEVADGLDTRLEELPDGTAEIMDGDASEASPDIADAAPETGPPDTSPPLCGDRLLTGGEGCDDGNDCRGDGCAACTVEPTLVLTRLALSLDAGFDLDDADRDGDRATGVDNRLAASGAIAARLNSWIADLIATAHIMQLATLSGLDDPRDDPALDLILHPGRDPACLSAPPYPWLEAPGASVHASSFPACLPPVIVRAADHPDNGLSAGRLVAAAQSITLPLGTLGTFAIARARLEADVALDASGEVSNLRGQLGGVLPAAALFRIDTSAFLPNCPTALHAVLGLVGHLDQDADDDGKIDFIRWTTRPDSVPCITGPVVISGCCIDGDCNDPASRVEGRDCPLDPRITDGYSLGLEVRAHAVRVTDVSDEVCAP